MSQAEALTQTVDALELRPEHAALIAYCEGLATALDAYPERATLWREYRPALELLLFVGEATGNDGEAEVIRLVSTPILDPKASGKGVARSRGGGGGEDPGDSADAVAGAGRKRRTGTAS